MKLSSGLVIIALASTLLAGCGEDPTTPTASDPEPSAATPPADPTPTEGNGDGDQSTSSPGSGDMVTVPIYFVGDSPMGVRLYREFRRVEADNPLDEATALLVAGDALDPDYATLLDGIDLGPIVPRDDSIDVGIAGGPYPRPDDMTGAEAEVAIQSLVYTLQGSTQTRLPIRFAGAGIEELLGIDITVPIDASAQLDVLSLVNVTTPESGATLSGSFTAEGVASSFEATVPWQIKNASGVVVAEDSAMAEGWFEKLYPWSTEIDISGLPPGEYTYAALTDDPSGGEGPGPFQDTKAITIE